MNPSYAQLAVDILENSQVKVAAVANFPLGASCQEALAAEAAALIAFGVDEIDLVMNIGAARSGDWEKVAAGVRALLEPAHEHGLLVKLILETCLLTDQEKHSACLLAKELQVDFVKTSTGFSSAGASVRDVQLLRSWVGESMGVKASGGIANRQQALALIAAGADRLGTSRGVSIVSEAAVG